MLAFVRRCWGSAGPRPLATHFERLLEAAFGSDVVEVAEVVVDADVVEHAAEAADRDAHSVGAAEAAELAAAFDVRLEVDDDAGDAALGELLFELRNHFGEVAKDALVAAVAEMGGDEVLEHFFVDVGDSADGFWVSVVFDVHPADAGFHREVLREDFVGGIALADDVAGVEDGDQRRVIHAAVELGDELARLADEVGFDFEAEGEIAAVAGFGDLAELVGGLRDVLARIVAFGRVEREAADQLGFEGVGQFAGVLTSFFRY